MKKQYFAWKDGKQSRNGRQEWTELTAKEYKTIYENNKAYAADKRRYLPCFPVDTYYFFVWRMLRFTIIDIGELLTCQHLKHIFRYFVYIEILVKY